MMSDGGGQRWGNVSDRRLSCVIAAISKTAPYTSHGLAHWVEIDCTIHFPWVRSLGGDW